MITTAFHQGKIPDETLVRNLQLFQGRIRDCTNDFMSLKDQMDRLMEKINELIPNPRQKIKMNVVNCGIYDELWFFNDDPEELGISSIALPKEPTKIKLNPK